MFNIKYVINHKYIIWAQFAHDFIGFYTFCKRNLVAATRTGAAKEMSPEKKSSEGHISYYIEYYM